MYFYKKNYLYTRHSFVVGLSTTVYMPDLDMPSFLCFLPLFPCYSTGATFPYFFVPEFGYFCPFLAISILNGPISSISVHAFFFEVFFFLSP